MLGVEYDLNIETICYRTKIHKGIRSRSDLVSAYEYGEELSGELERLLVLEHDAAARPGSAALAILEHHSLHSESVG